MSDDLVKRLLRADEYEPVGHDAWEAAARIQELETERDGLREKLEVAEEVAHADGTRADALAADLKDAVKIIASQLAALEEFGISGGAMPEARDLLARLEAREVSQ